MPVDQRRDGRRVPAEPWRSFLAELDAALGTTVELHCLGGFVVTQQYGIGRETSDIDFLTAITPAPALNLEAIAGVGSSLHRRHRLYVQHVGISTPPADYPVRLVRMFPKAGWKHLRLCALEANDLALSKLERNADRDREDVLRLAQAGYLDPDVLQTRYFQEVRPYLLDKVQWHDKTLELWLEMAWPHGRGLGTDACR